jgi:Ca-activated chloride channel homolog
MRRASHTHARVAVCACAAQLVLLLLLCTPGSSMAQSGCKRPEATPTPTPNAQRPRRAANEPDTPPPHRPPADQPGQPETPNEPRNVPTPTPAPLKANEPNAGENVDIDPGEVVHVNANLVPIPATVIDESGHAITDLQVNDFELRVDGQPKPIGDVTRTETPVRLALLFDNSTSQHAARELEKQGATRFLRNVIRPIDQAAIFSIWTEPVLEQTMTNDINKLVRVIEHYGEPEGATALFDTVVLAADYLRTQPGRKVIVIFSDGVENISRLEDFNEVLRRVQLDDCQVYVVQDEIGDNANTHDLVAESRMRELTAQTGGAVFPVAVVSDLPAAYAQISADLAQQYVLSYYPDDDARATRFRIISLRVKTRPKVRVRARRGYYPRKGEQASSGPSSYTDIANTQAAADTSAPADSAREQTAGTQTQPNVANLRARAPATGPSYGSKNLNPDDDGVSSRRSALPATLSAAGEHAEAAPPAEPPEMVSRPAARVEVAANAAPPPVTDRASPPTPQPALSSPTPTDTHTDAPTSSPTTEPTPTSQPQATDTKTNAAAQSSKQAAAAAAAPVNSDAQAAAAAKAPVSGGVLNGRALRLPKPSYPPTAQRMHVVGAVNVEVTIDENGKVIAAHAVSGHALLREAAVAAARQAQFTPTILSGKPVQITGVIVYNFSQ